MTRLERIYRNDLLKDVIVVRNGWKALFDPSTTDDNRKAIKLLFREFIEDGSLLKPASGQSQYYFFGTVQPHEPGKPLYMSKLPPGYMQLSEQTQIIGIMNRGFHYAGYFSPILKSLGLAKEPPILAGYSSGMYNHDESKTFSDGTSMCGKVFILKEDLKKALASPEIVFIDDYIDTGTTMAAIGNALRQQGYSGKMYTLDENSSIYAWSGWIRGRPSVEVPQIIPVITEIGEEAGPLCEAAKLAVRK